MNIDLTAYRIPEGKKIDLTNKLAKEIKDRFDTIRENRYQLFLMAAGLRMRYSYMEETSSGNERPRA